MAARSSRRRKKPVRPASSRELARSVRKPAAPPARIEKSSKAYDRRRPACDLDDEMEGIP
jgi:hypothetical protein